MADGVSGIGSAPFNVGSEIHQQSQTRERIEAHLTEQRVAKDTGGNHDAPRSSQRTEVGLRQGL